MLIRLKIMIACLKPIRGLYVTSKATVIYIYIHSCVVFGLNVTKNIQISKSMLLTYGSF